jgi:hypothetical protein
VNEISMPAGLADHPITAVTLPLLYDVNWTPDTDPDDRDACESLLQVLRQSRCSQTSSITWSIPASAHARRYACAAGTRPDPSAPGSIANAGAPATIVGTHENPGADRPSTPKKESA